jgi:hypothetical protein
LKEILKIIDTELRKNKKKMSLKDDLMYPFGNPLIESISNEDRVALHNVLSLARERIWLAKGRPMEITHNFDEVLLGDDLKNAELSVDVVNRLSSLLDSVGGTKPSKVRY